MNPYKVLGINQNASLKEAKEAFKQLAKKYHPDTNKSPDAEAKFKEINQALDMIKNPEKYHTHNAQRTYQSNWEFDAESRRRAEEDLANIFRAFAKNSNRAKINLYENIDLLRAFTGYSKKITVDFLGKQHSIDIAVPAGVRNKQTLDYDFTVSNGDKKQALRVTLTVGVIDSGGFKRNDNDLVVKASVNVLDLIIGTGISVETICGKTLNINIPAGQPAEGFLRVPGYGMPEQRTNQRGDLLVQITPLVPIVSDSNVLKQIQEIRKEIP